MRKIKDKVTLGMVAGLTGSAVFMAAQYGAYRLGWTTTTWPQQATGATVSRRFQKKHSARALGTFIGLFVDAFYGVAQTYMYSLTGKDQLVVKSTGAGVLSWLILHGLASRLTDTFKPHDPPPSTAFVSLLNSPSRFVYLCGDYYQVWR